MLLNPLRRYCCICKKRGDNLNAKGKSLTEIKPLVKGNICSFFNISIPLYSCFCGIGAAPATFADMTGTDRHMTGI